ncbi:uncharacterized protein LOC112604100 [Melanaphis sacchari]|uniref:uncharacterized protein LOC112604100 n=1 Tax=Melanaphis sacchari TaxID=742174 RepID=UPI000DC139A4|nr:uncharacterized protein LOC112604100 [Melanaphis sacchari]
MNAICSIPNCENKPPKVKLFKIPIAKNLRRMWLLSIKQHYPNYSVSSQNNSESYICSEHFKDQDFIHSEKEFLNSFAIPTVFNNDSYIYVDIYGLLHCPTTNDSEADDSE